MLSLNCSKGLARRLVVNSPLPSTHVAMNGSVTSSSRQSNVLFWPLRALHECGAQTDVRTKCQIVKCGGTHWFTSALKELAWSIK